MHGCTHACQPLLPDACVRPWMTFSLMIVMSISGILMNEEHSLLADSCRVLADPFRVLGASCCGLMVCVVYLLIHFLC